MEEAQDYRYFPEPDLVPMVLDRSWSEEVRRTLPELPEQRKQRYVEQYALSPHDAALLVEDKAMADFFEAAVKLFPQPKAVCNWLLGDVMGYLNARGMEFTDLPLTPEKLAGMLKLMEDGTISIRLAKEILEEMLATGKDAASIVAEKGLVQIRDEDALRAIVEEGIAENPNPVRDYRAGKEKALTFLVGQVMRKTSGRGGSRRWSPWDRSLRSR